jgi:NAD-dependent deacetylase
LSNEIITFNIKCSDVDNLFFTFFCFEENSLLDLSGLIKLGHFSTFTNKSVFLLMDVNAEKMKTLVVLSGAGMSAESGIKTFRDMGGIWEQYDVTEVASPEGWAKHPDVVLEFYNQRRKQLFESSPNKGHYLLAGLEKDFKVKIITQNVDDLHERAGSTNVLHLHGELKKARSTVDPNLVYELDHWELKLGDKCEKGSQLRPHVVWFGESVPAISEAEKIVETADIFVVIGTSLNVYPAAGLLWNVPENVPVYLIDPGDLNIRGGINVKHIKKKASEGIEELKSLLKNEN